MKDRAEGKDSILIVDDERIIVRMLEAALPDMGYDCVAVNNGAAALELIKETSFDIVLTDVHMPGMSGFELTEEAKRIRPDLLVIIMTGFSKDFSYDAAIKAGAADFIKKPFTMKELEARLEHVRMQERLRAMAVTDDLTGLLNRWGFFALAEQVMRLANRTGNGFLLLYAGVDGLKEINDTFGHAAGEQALIETARILRATYRKSDIIARVRGDHFVVISVEASKDDAEVVLGRFQAGLDSFNEKRHGGYRLSVSVGVLYYDPAESRSIDTLLAEGDRMLNEHMRLKQTSVAPNMRPAVQSPAKPIGSCHTEASASRSISASGAPSKLPPWKGASSQWT